MAVATHANVPFTEILNMRLAEEASGQPQVVRGGGRTVKKPFLKRGEGLARRMNASRLKKEAENKREEWKRQRRKGERKKSRLEPVIPGCSASHRD